MTATLLKLLSNGIQTERLYSKSSKSLYPFIKVWYKVTRYTSHWSRIDFNSQPNLGKKASIRIPRKGNLITRAYLVTSLPDIGAPQYAAQAIAGPNNVTPTWGWTNGVGYALTASINVTIGGAKASQQDTRLLSVLDDYTTPINKVPVMNRLIGQQSYVFEGHALAVPPRVPPEPVVPMGGMWFSNNDPGSALPIAAVNNDEIIIEIDFRNIQGLIYSQQRVANNTSLEAGSAYPPILGATLYNKTTGDPVGQMPTSFNLGDTYFMCEYMYLDQNEAMRSILSDMQKPILQYYALKPAFTNGAPRITIPLDIPNPTKNIYWMVQRVEAESLNAYFLGTRDLSKPKRPGEPDPEVPWWPNAQGLTATAPNFLYPAFAYSDSEPLNGIAIVYEGNLVRARTQAPGMFRSIFTSYEQNKSPWTNRFYYCYPLGVMNGTTRGSEPKGAANLDKIKKRELYLEFRPNRGSVNPNDVPSYVVYVWAETYNVMRTYGGRASQMFTY